MNTFEAILGIITSLVAIIVGVVTVIISGRTEKSTAASIKTVREIAEKEPDKNKPAWDLAQVMLEAYFRKNLNQISWIFSLAVIVMVVGFFIVIWGIYAIIAKPGFSSPAIVSAIAGVITEFIGATFIIIYKSTLEQSINHMKALTKMNVVGMAMQILDTIPPEANKDSLKEWTKAKVVEKLMERASDFD